MSMSKSWTDPDTGLMHANAKDSAWQHAHEIPGLMERPLSTRVPITCVSCASGSREGYARRQALKQEMFAQMYRMRVSSTQTYAAAHASPRTSRRYST
jgi:hypothetical protein